MLNFDPLTAYSARQAAEIEKEMEEQRRYNAQKDAAIFQTAEENKKQNKLLCEQVNALKEQNELLKKMYDSAKADAEESKKQSKHDKIFAWASFVVGTIIGIAGVVLGLIF